MPRARFLCCERSSWQRIMMPLGLWKICTALLVMFTCWPPGPPEPVAWISRSLSLICTSTSSASGSTATVAVEV